MWLVGCPRSLKLKFDLIWFFPWFLLWPWLKFCLWFWSWLLFFPWFSHFVPDSDFCSRLLLFFLPWSDPGFYSNPDLTLILSQEFTLTALVLNFLFYLTALLLILVAWMGNQNWILKRTVVRMFTCRGWWERHCLLLLVI